MRDGWGCATRFWATLARRFVLAAACAAASASADTSVAEHGREAANEAASAIEKMTCYEAAAVALDGHPGSTWTALTSIVALGESAKTILAQLASSKNPVARIAAIVGFERLYPALNYPPDVRGILVRLLVDHEKAETRVGCDGAKRPVKHFANHALNGQRGVNLEIARSSQAAIEEMKKYEPADECDGPVPGVAWRVVNRLVQLAEADSKPLLLELSRSKNPVARATATVGLTILFPKRDFPADVRSRLEQLDKDNATFDVLVACKPARDTVGAFARRALGR